MISDYTQHVATVNVQAMAAAKQCQSETFFPFSFGQAVEVCGEDYLEQHLSGDLVVRKPWGLDQGSWYL